jgi:hypothetical protein
MDRLFTVSAHSLATERVDGPARSVTMTFACCCNRPAVLIQTEPVMNDLGQGRRLRPHILLSHVNGCLKDFVL